MFLWQGNITLATASYNKIYDYQNHLMKPTRIGAANLLGVLPYSEQFDDPDEPSISDVYKEKFHNMMDSPMNFIKKIGTLMFDEYDNKISMLILLLKVIAIIWMLYATYRKEGCLEIILKIIKIIYVIYFGDRLITSE